MAKKQTFLDKAAKKKFASFCPVCDAEIARIYSGKRIGNCVIVGIGCVDVEDCSREALLNTRATW